MIVAQELRKQTKKMAPIEDHLKYIEEILLKKAEEGFHQVAVYCPVVYFKEIKKALINSGYEVQKGDTYGEYSQLITIYW